MLAVNYTNLRDNMKAYMDKVTDDYETMIVTRKNNKNIVKWAISVDKMVFFVYNTNRKF